jgi:hypothetical protein
MTKLKAGKGLLTLVALSMAFSLVVIALPMASPVEASPDWYNANWSKRRPVTIDNTGNPSALTDYQVLINVAYDSDMQPDFDDLMFTDSNGATELNYWIMEKTDSVSAWVWVKVPSIPASSTKTIFMYYDNPAASSASNGDNTFLFFDDFGDDSSLDTTKWDEIATGATVNWSSPDYVEVSGTTGLQDWQIRTKNSDSVDFIAEYKLDIVSFSGSAVFTNRVVDETNTYVGLPVNWGRYAANIYSVRDDTQ